MNTKLLKAKILDLAIRGKLVPQNPNDESAAVLLEKIRKEKGGESIPLGRTSLRPTPSSGGHPRNAPDASISEDEIPFEIPEEWVWCKLSEITTILGDGLHGSPKYDDNGDYYFINGNNLENGRIVFRNDTRKVNESEFQKYKKNLNKNTVLVSINGTIGNIAFYNNEKIILGKSACYFNLCLEEFKQYLYWLIKSDYFLDYANTSATGSTIKNVSLDAMRNFFIPLPPLAEQQRIVDAIEKAFEQIDIIEKNKLDLKTYVKQTKSKILDLAIRGKLLSPADVVQCRNKEESANALLEKIRNEKTELIKQKKLKPDPKSSIIIKAADGKHYEQFPDGTLKNIEDEIPFEIPEGWAWCYGYDFFSPMTSRNPSGDNFKYIDIEVVDNKRNTIDSPKIMPVSKAPSRASRETFPGDILFSMVRPYLRNIALVTDALTDCIASTGFFVCRPRKPLFSKYIFYLMTSNYVVNGINQFMKGDNSPSVTGDDILNFLYPLPPLAEQQRIVEVIEKAFEQLDKIEKSLGE